MPSNHLGAVAALRLSMNVSLVDLFRKVGGLKCTEIVELLYATYVITVRHRYLSIILIVSSRNRFCRFSDLGITI